MRIIKKTIIIKIIVKTTTKIALVIVRQEARMANERDTWWRGEKEGWNFVKHYNYLSTEFPLSLD